MLSISFHSTLQLLYSCHLTLCVFFILDFLINLLHFFLQLSLLKLRTQILLFFLLFLILLRKIRRKIRRFNDNIDIRLLILRSHLRVQSRLLKFQIFHQLRDQFLFLVILPSSFSIFFPLKISSTLRTLNIHLVDHFLNPSKHGIFRYLTRQN